MECFSAPEVAADGVWCGNWAFSAPEVVARCYLASNGVFSCTKSCIGQSLVQNKGFFRTGTSAEKVLPRGW